MEGFVLGTRFYTLDLAEDLQGFGNPPVIYKESVVKFLI
jgi:hypothetical protein